MSQKETWKSVEGYKGIYQVSNLGRVKSLDRQVSYKSGLRFFKGQLLKPLIQKNKDGYSFLRVNLYRNGKIHTAPVHRLVAIHFIPNPDGKSVVNHIDFNTMNNAVSNLEWMTQKENVNHSWDNGRCEIWNKGKRKFKHGTANEYNRHGCRCSKCVEFMRQKWKSQQKNQSI